jgi:hypothetical protein
LGGAGRSGGEELDDQSRIVESVTVVMEKAGIESRAYHRVRVSGDNDDLPSQLLAALDLWSPLRHLTHPECSSPRIDLFIQIFIKRNVEEGG